MARASLFGNPLITVTGNTATSKVAFTGIRLEKADGQPQVVVQARWYAAWERSMASGYGKRNIFAGTKHPDWWKE